MQGGKLRCIDDLSEPGVNAAVGSAEKLTLMGLDAMAFLVREVDKAIGPDGSVKVRFQEGRTLEGRLHASWTGDRPDLGLVAAWI